VRLHEPPRQSIELRLVYGPLARQRVISFRYLSNRGPLVCNASLGAAVGHLPAALDRTAADSHA
jgi:hypothetical protein